MTLPLFGLAGASAIICALIVPAIGRWATRRRIVAVANARSSHTGETPVGGGLPIAFCAIAGAVGLGWMSDVWSEPWWISYAIGAGAVAAVSWHDDLDGASTTLRLAVHTGAALLVVLSVYEFRVSLATLPTAALAIVWIVGVTNAYNFMDGLDGLAGAHAVIAGAGWAMLGWQTQHPLVAALGAIVSGASAGFLPHNWHRARIFMGDVGAALLGFTFAVLPVVAFPSLPGLAFAGALALWPFLFDTTFTLCRRLRRRENVLEAHRTHLYQRLMSAGWSHPRVATTYAVLAATGVLLGWMAMSGQRVALIAVTLVLSLLCFALWAVTISAERRRALKDHRGVVRPT